MRKFLDSLHLSLLFIWFVEVPSLVFVREEKLLSTSQIGNFSIEPDFGVYSRIDHCLRLFYSSSSHVKVSVIVRNMEEICLWIEGVLSEKAGCEIIPLLTLIEVRRMLVFPLSFYFALLSLFLVTKFNFSGAGLVRDLSPPRVGILIILFISSIQKTE